MTAEDELEFEIEILDSEASEEELDKMTRNLLSELRGTDVESANLVSIGTAPEGIKGDPITIGTIAIAVLPAAIPSLITFIQAWILRGQGRTMKFKGKGIEFEGSSEELQKLIDSLNIGKK